MQSLIDDEPSKPKPKSTFVKKLTIGKVSFVMISTFHTHTDLSTKISIMYIIAGVIVVKLNDKIKIKVP